MSEDMVKDGYENIMNIDISSVAIEMMRKKYEQFSQLKCVIGNSYVKPNVLTRSFKEKPLKLNSTVFRASEIWEEKDFPNPAASDTMHQDIEEFLFKMLGEGFFLDKSVIQDIVGQCGYDVTKSMVKFRDLSASKLEKSDDILVIPSEKAINENPTIKLIQCETPLSYTSSRR